MLASFSVVVNVRRAAWLLDALARIVFAIAAADVWQLVRIGLPVHRVWEALAVACLVHGWAGAAARHSADASDAAYAADGALLNAASLGADHVDAGVVGVGAVDTDGGVAWSLVRTAVIDSVLVAVGGVRMVAARGHWNAVLLDVEVRVVGGASAGGACTIYTVGRCTAGDHNALAVLEGSRRVRAHDVAQVRRYVRGSNLGIWHAIHHGRSGSPVHVVLATLVAAVWIARVVGVVGRGRDDTGVRACARYRRRVALAVVAWGVLLILCEVAVVVSRRVAGVAAVGCVVLFARLWADAAKAAEARAALARVVVMVVVVGVCVANRAPALVDVLIWTQMVVVCGVYSVVAVPGVVHVDVRTDVGLSKLIQDRPGSFGVDGRDLRHYLPVIVV